MGTQLCVQKWNKCHKPSLHRQSKKDIIVILTNHQKKIQKHTCLHSKEGLVLNWMATSQKTNVITKVHREARKHILRSRLRPTWRVRMLCHEKMAFKPLDNTWITFESSGLRLTYSFFNSTAAKLIAYLQHTHSSTCLNLGWWTQKCLTRLNSKNSKSINYQ